MRVGDRVRASESVKVSKKVSKKVTRVVVEIVRKRRTQAEKSKRGGLEYCTNYVTVQTVRPEVAQSLVLGLGRGRGYLCNDMKKVQRIIVPMYPM